LGETTAAADAERLCARVARRTRGDAVKVVLDAAEARDVASALAVLADPAASPPRVALALGAAGVSSRVLGRRFMPATHDALPAAAAPGQLSPSRCLELRVSVGALPARTSAESDRRFEGVPPRKVSFRSSHRTRFPAVSWHRPVSSGSPAVPRRPEREPLKNSFRNARVESYSS